MPSLFFYHILNCLQNINLASTALMLLDPCLQVVHDRELLHDWGHSYCMGYEEVNMIEDKITNTPQNIVQEELNDGLSPYFTVVRRRLRIHVIFDAVRSWASEGTSKAVSQESQQGSRVEGQKYCWRFVQ